MCLAFCLQQPRLACPPLNFHMQGEGEMQHAQVREQGRAAASGPMALRLDASSCALGAAERGRLRAQLAADLERQRLQLVEQRLAQRDPLLRAL